MSNKTEQTVTDTLRFAAKSAMYKTAMIAPSYLIAAADIIDNLRAQLAEAQAALKTVMRNAELSKEPCGGPTMDDAIAAGDGTLHGAIDHWQQRALSAERILVSRDAVLEEAAQACEARATRASRADMQAMCRLCAKAVRALKAHELAGRHVHLGKLKAVQTCCVGEKS